MIRADGGKERFDRVLPGYALGQRQAAVSGWNSAARGAFTCRGLKSTKAMPLGIVVQSYKAAGGLRNLRRGGA
jgi:hypothetical protein